VSTRAGAAPAGAAGARSSASTIGPRRSRPRSLPVPTATAPRRNGYRLRGRIFDELAAERRRMIEAADVELVERDGRVWQLRRLPSAVSE
jgi:hypothetical protein